MKHTSEQAMAKINLCLDVTGKRANGYHEIDGIMQSITLSDLITVGFEEGEETEIRLSAEGNPDMPTDSRNLAWRAAEKLLDAAAVCGLVEIHIQKRIPMAGGLAGGSTDAAAVLRALNRLLPKPLSIERLCEIGGRLGADVPFCVVGGAMRTRGIGDILTPVPSMPDCHLVIARRGEGVSTPWAYGKLDEIYADFADRSLCPDSGLKRLLGALEEGNLEGVCASVYNIFEDVVAKEKPDVTAIRREMLLRGALVSRMSGSGPCVFGIFDCEQAATSARDSLQSLGADAFVCAPFAQNFS